MFGTFGSSNLDCCLFFLPCLNVEIRVCRLVQTTMLLKCIPNNPTYIKISNNIKIYQIHSNTLKYIFLFMDWESFEAQVVPWTEQVSQSLAKVANFSELDKLQNLKRDHVWTWSCRCHRGQLSPTRFILMLYWHDTCMIYYLYTNVQVYVLCIHIYAGRECVYIRIYIIYVLWITRRWNVTYV